jgi:hypothetical protein
MVDAQTEARLSGEVELNYDTYDRLIGMIEDYGNREISKDEVRQEISNAVGKDIPTTIARSLRDKLATKDKPDDPMNRSDVKRGLGVLVDLESFEVEQAKKDDADLEVIREIRLVYQRKMNEYEQWVKDQEKEKLTDIAIQNKITEMTEMEAEGVILKWWERWLRPKESTPFFRHFGTTEETALARKKAKAGVEEEKSPYPEYPEAFLEDGVWKVIRDGKTYRIE